MRGFTRLCRWFAGWLSRLWDGTDHSTEVKLLLFSVAILSTIVWLSLSLVHNDYEINIEWKSALDSLLLATAAGAGISAWAVSRLPKKADDEEEDGNPKP